MLHFDWMLQVDPPQETTSLADLSRNASVISTSSSDDALASPCIRPRRTFSAPRSKSPPQNPSFRPNDLGYSPMSKPRSKSRAREATPQDFKFGQTLGFGSYSEVRLSSPPQPRLPSELARRSRSQRIYERASNMLSRYSRKVILSEKTRCRRHLPRGKL